LGAAAVRYSRGMTRDHERKEAPPEREAEGGAPSSGHPLRDALDGACSRGPFKNLLAKEPFKSLIAKLRNPEMGTCDLPGTALALLQALAD